MPVDLACPNCREQVQVQHDDSICPQCGTNLHDAQPAEGTAQQDETNASRDDFAGFHAVDSGAHAPDFDALSAGDEAPAQDAPASRTSSANDPEPGHDEAPPAFAMETAAPRDISVESATGAASERATAAHETAPAAPPSSPGVSRRLFLVVLSYAICATLVLVLAWLRMRDPDQLESLPDIVPNYRETLPDLKPPLDEQGNVIRQIVPPDAGLPAGHTLVLGESRRFGNVRITPLKVTREMLEFQHYRGDASRRSAEGPVLKLWLKFENLSEDQAFAPLDRDLLYFRGRTSADSFDLRANNFVARRGQMRADDLVLVYDLVLDGEWDPKSQSLGTLDSPRLLHPGEQLVTYVPTQPHGIEDLNGELVWRVHIRKGYHPQSGRGATTLIDIAFHSRDIQTPPNPDRTRQKA